MRDRNDLQGLQALPPRTGVVLGGPDLQTRDERDRRELVIRNCVGYAQKRKTKILMDRIPDRVRRDGQGRIRRFPREIVRRTLGPPSRKAARLQAAHR